MNTRQHAAAAAAALVLAVTLAGCSTPPRTPQDGATASPSAGATAAPSGSDEAEAGWNRADLAFAEDMADHAERSVRLAETALTVSDLPPGARELATQIRDEQAPQVQTLKGWAEEWGSEDGASGSTGTEDREEAGGVAGGEEAAGGSDSAGGSEAMTEEMSDAAFTSELTALKAASGNDAGRLFLQGMIAQHQQGIEMADGEAQLGTSTEAIGLAGAVSSTQGEQLTKMRALLGSYGG